MASLQGKLCTSQSTLKCLPVIVTLGNKIDKKTIIAQVAQNLEMGSTVRKMRCTKVCWQDESQRILVVLSSNNFSLCHFISCKNDKKHSSAFLRVLKIKESMLKAVCDLNNHK